MIQSKPMVKITAAVHRDATEPLLEQLRSLPLPGGCGFAAGRSLVLNDKSRMPGVGSRSALAQDPVEVLSLLVPDTLENATLHAIISTARLDRPGQGSVLSEPVDLLRAHEAYSATDAAVETAPCPSPSSDPLLTELMGVCCIVQRGQGNAVARVALDTGTCVPWITHGRGTGVRDKLGLLRITIPAEKEIITLAASIHDADAIMDLMIHAGRLDQPGRGFIFLFPIGRGLINTKISRGMPRSAASIEQIISAMDQIQGGTQWRSRGGMAATGKTRRAYLVDRTGLTLQCNQGRADALVQSAMQAGAAGATLERIKHVALKEPMPSGLSPAQESCDMIVAGHQLPLLLEALETANAFDDQTHGVVYRRPVPKACTYLQGVATSSS